MRNLDTLKILIGNIEAPDQQLKIKNAFTLLTTLNENMNRKLKYQWLSDWEGEEGLGWACVGFAEGTLDRPFGLLGGDI
jgi:hypothetical protein